MRKLFTPFVTLTFALLLLALALQVLPVAARPDGARTINNVIINNQPQNLTVTSTQTITPTHSFITLNNSAELTLTLAVADGIEGDTLLVVSEVTTATNLQTTNTALAAAQVMTQNDIIQFVLANSQWIPVNIQDNAAD